MAVDEFPGAPCGAARSDHPVHRPGRLRQLLDVQRLLTAPRRPALRVLRLAPLGHLRAFHRFWPAPRAPPAPPPPRRGGGAASRGEETRPPASAPPFIPDHPPPPARPPIPGPKWSRPIQ